MNRIAIVRRAIAGLTALASWAAVAPVCAGPPAIAAGGEQSLALKADGSVWVWGYRGEGEPSPANAIVSPSQVKALRGITAAAVSAQYHFLALQRDGRVRAWGWNFLGQLGDGSREPKRDAPIQMKGMPRIVAVAAGANFSLALDADGNVWTWGSNLNGESGELGEPARPLHIEPVHVRGLSAVRAIAAGSTDAYALDASGNVWTWGRSALPDDALVGADVRYAPVRVPGLDEVVAIATGGEHMLALKSDGTVSARGLNFDGRLGDGSRVSRAEPERVPNLGGVVAIAAGRRHSMALRSDGSVWTWGGNDEGQLGNGTTTDRPFPVRVAKLDRIVAIAAGGRHCLALRADGSLWSWGHNDTGQLGDGSTLGRTQPVRVGAPGGRVFSVGATRQR